MTTYIDHYPPQWDLKRLKDLADFNRDSLDEDTPADHSFRYIDISGVDEMGRIVGREDTVFERSPSRARRLASHGDVVISTVRTYLRAIAKVPKDCADLVFSTGFAVLHPWEALVDPEFLWRALQAEPYVQWIVAHSQGVGYPAINPSELGQLRIGIPVLLQQRAIAAFLDRETAKIDALIEKKERLLALLEEKRAALITRAVTKGLDPAVPMKDSGVEWLGDVPARWDVKRVKFTARLKTGHTPSRQHPEYWVDCSIPWFGLADVWQIRDGKVEYVTETTEQISELGLANSAAELLPKGTVILSRTASVGFSAILGVDMATTQDFVNWVPGPVLRAEFLLYVFRSMAPEFRRMTMGSTHQTIYWPDVGRLVGPLPPLEEQDAIVAHIRQQCARLDALTARTREAMTLLREYRTALISAAVTGQIDVRHGTRTHDE